MFRMYTSRLFWLGVFAFGAGVYYVCDQFDKKFNYVPVQARVTDVKETCYMEMRSGRRTSTSDMLACDDARELVAKHPKWQGYHVKSRIEVSYEFVSPVDRRTHRGARTLSAYPNGKPISRGELIDIRASKTDPNRSREI